jgi:adenylate kinase
VAGADEEAQRAPVRVIFLGYPGAGKGTQAARLAKHFGVPKISTGDMLRDAIAEGSELGREAAPLMERGDLVPDRLLIKLIEERIGQDDCARGCILDGFPRTLPQAEGLEGMTFSDRSRAIVVKIEVPREQLLQRLSGRRWCPKCQATFHVVSRMPRDEGVCDKCGTRLIQRDDDKETVVARRLSEYDERTQPLVGYYEEKGAVHRIDGNRPMDTVFGEIREIVDAALTQSHARG